MIYTFGFLKSISPQAPRQLGIAFRPFKECKSGIKNLLRYIPSFCFVLHWDPPLSDDPRFAAAQRNAQSYLKFIFPWLDLAEFRLPDNAQFGMIRPGLRISALVILDPQIDCARAAVDEIAECAAIIARDGRMIRGKFGPREHPLIKTQLALRAFVCRTLQRLGLNLEPTKPVGRPSEKFDWADVD